MSLYAIDCHTRCNLFSIGVYNFPLCKIESIFQMLFLIVHLLMLLNVNTYANSVIESSFVLMNVCLPYTCVFNC